ncbi:MAG TPA: hypothetical protein HA355_05425 [Methanosphaera sp.]|nr:hypothetical protein [Methanosphaera sp.]HII09014.1 hypothetical protein [Methanosphaera sp.]
MSDKNSKMIMLNEFEKQINVIFNNFYENQFNFEELKTQLKWFIKVWNISRVDIKNIGNESNSIRIYEKEIRYEKSLNISNPEWYTDNTGKGTKIEFENNKMNIGFQCINNGDVNINLRGVDYRNSNNERLPIYLNIKKVILNNKVFLNHDQLICHDEPFVINRRSHNLERINLEIQSETIYDYFPELNMSFENMTSLNYLESKYDELLQKINEYKIEIGQEKADETSSDEKRENSLRLSKTNVAMFGSCVSIDPFRSCYNDYKRDFNKKYEHQRSTIISLMNPKIEYSEDDLVYLIDSHDKNIVTTDIKKDFDKEIFNHLDDIDYLIINLVHDVRWGVLAYEDTYITNSEYIANTEFYKKNKDNLRPINLKDNEEEYYNIWTESCDKFFEYLSEHFPNLKVILQKIELVDYYIGFDCTYKFRQDFHDQAVTLNPFFKKLESYIENNFDVEVIPFPADTTADEGNIWGLYTTHYTMTYYQYVYNEIKIRCLENKIKKIEDSF